MMPESLETEGRSVSTVDEITASIEVCFIDSSVMSITSLTGDFKASTHKSTLQARRAMRMNTKREVVCFEIKKNSQHRTIARKVKSRKK